MEKKAVVVQIEDLREFVGGSADIEIKDAPLGHGVSSQQFNSTSMCYHSRPMIDGSSDWTVVKGE